MEQLGGVGRNLGELVPILGKGFAKKLSTIKNDGAFIPPENKYYIHQCNICTLEHITKAQVYFGEWLKDKDLYKFNWCYALGELGCGEIESIQMNNSLSKLIRIEKNKMTKDKKYSPDFDKLLKEALQSI